VPAQLGTPRIGFRSLTESIDTTTSGGKLIFHIFDALAEFEHDLIRERTNAGLAAARARGRKGGRQRAAGLDDDRKRAIAQSLYNDKQNSIAMICDTLHVCDDIQRKKGVNINENAYDTPSRSLPLKYQ
jgi:DNA invertase Pin-like site-specific DNA recombinase